MKNPNRYRLDLARFRTWFASVILFATLLVPGLAWGAPEARILRIDPRASQNQGDPILTTVIELVQSKRVSEATGNCAGARGNALYDCMAQSLERPNALYTSFSPFPEKNAFFTVTVDGADLPAKFVRQAKWGDSLQKPGVGTAWLILVDADSRMGKSFGDAKTVAHAFVRAMGPNDIVNVMYFNDRQIVSDSKWMPTAQKARADSFIDSVGATFPSQGRNRSLLTIIKNGATSGFKALGDVGTAGVKVPLHQAMVVLSSGFGGTDPGTTGPGALQLSQYMTQGRYPENNTALPKMPTPVISVYFPHQTFDEFKQNSMEFMQNMANPEIGGFFTIMRAGQGERAPQIVNAVRTRFSKLHIVEWRVSCVSPGVEQSFKLVFNKVDPPILGDNSFRDVPVAIDPTAWPLDVNIEYTKKMSERDGGVYPGGKLKVFGNFCWGGDKGLAEVYFLPAGQALPAELSSRDIDKAKRTQQQLIAMGMKGETLEASETYVEFEAPNKDKILHGSGKKAVVRLVVYDNKAKRISGVTADRIIELPGASRPFPILWVLVGAFGVVVLLLLIIVIVRSGGRRRNAPVPAPAGGYGGGYPPPGAGYAPPGGYGGPPMGGAPPMGGPPAAGFNPPPQGGPPPAAGAAPVVPMAAPAPMVAAPPAPTPPPVDAGPPPAAVQGMNPAFMYGEQGQAAVGVTGGMSAMEPGGPPPDPYAQPAGGAARAVLQGGSGVFTVLPGTEMRVGRDGAQCGILLTEPRVSGVHASAKLELGQLMVRDDNSNNGTLVNGNRLNPGVWTPVPNGSLVRFGPVEFNVRLE